MRRSEVVSTIDPGRLAELRQVEGFTWPMMLGNPGEWAGVPIDDSHTPGAAPAGPALSANGQPARRPQ